MASAGRALVAGLLLGLLLGRHAASVPDPGPPDGAGPPPWPAQFQMREIMYLLPPFHTRISTSYDRRLGNAEYNNFVDVLRRPDRTELVFFSAFGPGCVRNFWLLDDAGTLDWHLYIDGAEVPTPPMHRLGRSRRFPFPLAGVMHNLTPEVLELKGSLRHPGIASHVPLVFRRRCVMSVSKRHGDFPPNITDVLAEEIRTRANFTQARFAYWVASQHYHGAVPAAWPTYTGAARDEAMAQAANARLAAPAPLALDDDARAAVSEHTLRADPTTGRIAWTFSTEQPMAVTLLCVVAERPPSANVTLCFDAPGPSAADGLPARCWDPAIDLPAAWLFAGSGSKVVGEARATSLASPCRRPGDPGPLRTRRAPPSGRHFWLTLPMPFRANVTLTCAGIPEIRLRVAPLPPGRRDLAHLHASVFRKERVLNSDLLPLVTVPGGVGNFVGHWVLLQNARVWMSEGDQYLVWDGTRSAQVHCVSEGVRSESGCV